MLLGNPPVARPMPATAGGVRVSTTIGLKPDTSVGVGTSSVPYGPTNGYANPGNVTGFSGPAAGSLMRPSSWYIRTSGANTNGGTSASASPDRSGTDGSTTSGNLTFTSASAAFTPADIGKGICIQNATFCYAKITAINSATSVQLSNPPSATAGSLSWAIGGAWVDPRPFLNSNSFANTDCGVRPGDTVYIGAGTYRQVYTLGPNWGTLWNGSGATKLNPNGYYNGQVNIVGDVTGQYTGDAGMVQLTAYTTNDKTAPSGTAVITGAANRSNVSFSNIMFVGGASTQIVLAGAGCQNWSFTDCAFLAGATANCVAITLSVAAGQKASWTIDRCHMMTSRTSGNGQNILVTATGGYVGDYDVNFVVKNSVLFVPTGTCIAMDTAGGATGTGNGFHISNCTFFGLPLFLSSANLSTKLPSTIYGCMVYSANTSLRASASGQIIEDYNLISTPSARSNVSVGAHSISDGSYAPLFHFGQERIWLPPIPRYFGEPMANSPLLGFSPTGGGGPDTAPPNDLRGLLNPRPAGGSVAIPAVGALERSDTFIADPSPIGSGVSPVKLTGPGYNDIVFAINGPQVNQACTVSVAVQWDANYQGTLPTMIILAKPQMGILTNLVVTATGGSGSPVTITLPTFTPTAVGVLDLRLYSYDLSGSSVVEWDSMSIT